MSSSDEDVPVRQTMCWQEFLIDAVRARKILYDKSDRGYYDKDAKLNNWKDVAEALVSAGFSVIKNERACK